MADDSDKTLIRAYVRDHCESSFSELVHRHIDLVYSTALRVLRDANLAQDVTQRVFLTLARHSAKLQERVSLTGWLHETSRNLAINTVRSEERRRRREQEAASMKHLDANDSEILWQQLAPLLDEALAQLSVVERDVLLWRYFERRTAGQIGERLGLSAEAAQKRIARSLDRLRGILADRGLTASTVSIAGLVSAHAVQSAPVGLAATAIAAANAVSVAIPATSTLQILMASTKAKIGLAAVLAASVTTPLVLQHQANSRLRDELARLQAERAASPPTQAASTDTAELERLRSGEQELLRLRGEVTQLRRQLAGQSKPVRAGGDGRDKVDDRRAFELENARTLLAKAPEIPMVRSNQFRNAGYATAIDSFHTLNWAAANKQTNAMLNAVGLEPDARTRANELFAQMPQEIRQRYGTVDALLVDWAMNLSEAPEGYRVLAQREDSPDAATLTVQFQYPNSRVRENEVSFYRDQDGAWRRAMPAGIMEKLPHIVSSAQSPSGK
ncbi:MAG TPA: sigma-70 family RNA polymerase sigma factor [Candidatus Limnocylindrales bacterium]|jgi:RNA polymerase sigma factor (sigma-70 family)|nr:sigma-70 family RNA polymerase sigma factor [Candidatus Limnocylindrales bacterium]